MWSTDLLPDRFSWKDYFSLKFLYYYGTYFDENFLLPVFQTIYLTIEEFNTERDHNFVRVYNNNGMDTIDQS